MASQSDCSGHMIHMWVVWFLFWPIGTAYRYSTAIDAVLAAQKAGEHLSYCFWEEHESSGQFVRGLNVLVSIPRPSSAKACVIVVYHDCRHQNEHVWQISLKLCHWHGDEQSGSTKTDLFVLTHMTMLSLVHKLFILDHMTTFVIEIPHEMQKVA